MNRRTFLAKLPTLGMTAVLLLGVLPVAPAQAVTEPQRLIVTFDRPVNDRARLALTNAGGQVLSELPLINGTVVLVPNETAAERIRHVSGVTRAEADAIVRASGTPKCSPWPTCRDGGSQPPVQPDQAIEWGVNRIDADLTWSASRGTGVRVAVLDTGIDADHPDLTDSLSGGINFVSRNPRKPADANAWNDDNGHGTHVAGIIAAADNAIGVVGVAPEADLWAVKVLGQDGSGYTSWIIAGLDWAAANGMDVVNMSLGTPSDVQALHDAVDAAAAAGVTVVAAAGNSGDGNPATNEVEYPGAYGSTIAVGATDINDAAPYWSSTGPAVDVAAPGAAIRSTWNDGQYNTISGTSMATPHVAGAAALLLGASIRPEFDLNLDGTWSPDELRLALTSTAEDLGPIGPDWTYGNGLVDAERAIN